MKKKLCISLGMACLLGILFSMGTVSGDSMINNPKISAVPALQPIVPSPNIDGVVQLNWLLVYNVVGYSIYKTDPNGVTVRLERVWRGSTYRVSGLTNGIWQFQIRNVYNQNFGEFSNIVSIEVIIGGIIVDPPDTKDPVSSLPIEVIIILLIIGAGAIAIGILAFTKKGKKK
ncbi:hypothetical protein LCGC14_0770310 [marine sediment metagenome]|uniref:Fibronectin type-III domain-containing protein n=1 Tax=marine sediment metagenome TaxID=412755 RepID=A0A0F9SIN8_9ZZZZ